MTRITKWRQSRPIAVIVIATFLLAQVTLPIVRIGNKEARRFGWQMYSTVVPVVELTVITSDGSVVIDTERYVAAMRVEVELAELLPPHLCVVIPGALRVTWSDGTYEC